MLRAVRGFSAICALVTLPLPAWATHGSVEFVDSIDGSGPGVFAGTLTNPADSADWYSFAANAGASVTIAMQSASFDTFLFLYQVPGVPLPGDDRDNYIEIASDDDGGGGLNSLISFPSLPSTGNYMVAAESFSGATDPLGAYQLSITGNVRPVVPEPGTMALMLVNGLFAWLGRRPRWAARF